MEETSELKMDEAALAWPPSGELTVETAALFWKRSRQVKRMLDDLEAVIKQMLIDNPGKVPGLELAERKVPVVEDMVGAWRACKAAGWTPMDFVSVCKVSYKDIKDVENVPVTYRIDKYVREAK